MERAYERIMKQDNVGRRRLIRNEYGKIADGYRPVISERHPDQTESDLNCIRDHRLHTHGC